MKNKEEGLSILDLFKLIFFKWKRLLIIMAILTLVFLVGIHFGYTSLNKVYSIEFTYDDDNLENNHYADGTKFNYLDIISEDNIMTVIYSKGEYSKINYKNMLDKNEIGLIRSITNLDEVTANSNIEPKYSYEIRIKASCFGLINTKNLALNFLTDLIKKPLQKDGNIVANNNYKAYLNLADEAISYNDKIENLSEQLEYNNLTSKEVISLFGDFVADGNRLSTVVSGNDSYFKNNSLIVLSSLASQNGFTDVNDSSLKFYSNKKEALVLLINDNEKTISSLEAKRDEYILLGNVTTAEAFNEKIAELILENQEYINELTEVERCLYNIQLVNDTVYEKSNYVTAEEIKKYATKDAYNLAFDNFKADYNEAYAKINSYSNSVKDFSTYGYNNYTKMNYQNSSIILQSGGFNIVMEIIISLALAFVVAAIVNVIADRKHIGEITKKEE